jgi:anti-anti-sigma factor
MHLRSRFRRVGDTVVVELDGDADLASVPQLAQALSRALDQATGGEARLDVIVDLDALTVLDDAALGQLIGAAAAARRRNFTVRVLVTGDRIRRRLRDTRVDEIVEVIETLPVPSPTEGGSAEQT